MARKIISKLDLQFSLEAARAGKCRILYEHKDGDKGVLNDPSYWLSGFEVAINGRYSPLEYLWDLQEKFGYTFLTEARTE